MAFQITHDTFIDMVETTNFSYSRFGDTEFWSIVGKEGADGDGHAFTQEVGKQLQRILEKKPNYYLASRPMPDKLHKRIKHLTGDIDWQDCNIVKDMWQTNSIQRLVHVLSKRDVFYVRPKNLRGVIYANTYYEIPEYDAWKHIDSIERAVNDYVLDKDGVVVLFSAGMAANLLVDRLYETHGTKHSFIDIGSLFYPLIGKAVRSYQKPYV